VKLRKFYSLKKRWNFRTLKVPIGVIHINFNGMSVVILDIPCLYRRLIASPLSRRRISYIVRQSGLISVLRGKKLRADATGVVEQTLALLPG